MSNVTEPTESLNLIDSPRPAPSDHPASPAPVTAAPPTAADSSSGLFPVDVGAFSITATPTTPSTQNPASPPADTVGAEGAGGKSTVLATLETAIGDITIEESEVQIPVKSEEDQAKANAQIDRHMQLLGQLCGKLAPKYTFEHKKDIENIFKLLYAGCKSSGEIMRDMMTKEYKTFKKRNPATITDDEITTHSQRVSQRLQANQQRLRATTGKGPNAQNQIRASQCDLQFTMLYHQYITTLGLVFKYFEDTGVRGTLVWADTYKNSDNTSSTPSTQNQPATSAPK